MNRNSPSTLDRWRWPHRVLMGLSTFMLIFSAIGCVRSFYVKDAVYRSHHWFALGLTPKVYAELVKSPGSPLVLEHDTRCEFFSELGVLKVQMVTNTPFPHEDESGIPGVPTREWNWTKSRVQSCDLDSWNYPAGGGPGTWFGSLTDWRVPGLGVYPWAHAAYSVRTLEVPYPLIAIIFGTPGLVAARRSWVRSRLARRIDANRCVSCGYDLSGVAVAGPCPECGVPKSLVRPVSPSPLAQGL